MSDSLLADAPSPSICVALATQLRATRAETLKRWRARVEADEEFQRSAHFTRAQFYDHVPLLLEAFTAQLEGGEKPASDSERTANHEVAVAHSLHRWQQGFDLRSLVREWGYLNACLLESLDEIASNGDWGTGPGAFAMAREMWSEVVSQNLSESVTHYNELLQTEAKVRLAELEGALEHVRALERERGEVLRQVSHDLRGSLSVVAGASSLLEVPTLPPDDRTRVTAMLQDGVRALSEMLGAMLDVSRLEAGHEVREVAVFDAASLLRTLGATSQSLAEEKSLTLRIDGPLELWVEGDANKVRRIAQNLLLNALKYTSSGTVTLRWKRLNPESWRLEVLDSGPGLERSNAAPLAEMLASATEIAREVGAQSSQSEGEGQTPDPAPAVLPRLANVPENVPDTLANVPGEGIGLSIVRRLCELLGATLELDSSPQGSSFRVIFPANY